MEEIFPVTYPYYYFCSPEFGGLRNKPVPGTKDIKTIDMRRRGARFSE